MGVVVEAKKWKELSIVNWNGEKSRGGQEGLRFEVERHDYSPVSPTRSPCQAFPVDPSSRLWRGWGGIGEISAPLTRYVIGAEMRSEEAF